MPVRALTYVLKSDLRDNLISAIESLALHKPFFSGKVSEALLAAFLARPAQEASTLTEGERGIVRLIAEGQTNKEIAKMLNIALKSVETRRAAVMKKLGLSYSAELVRYAIRNGLVESLNRLDSADGFIDLMASFGLRWARELHLQIEMESGTPTLQ